MNQEVQLGILIRIPILNLLSFNYAIQFTFQLTEFSQLYNNSYNFEYSIEKLHINA